MPRLASHSGCAQLWAKDEGQNPTGSFKARGLGMAMTRARTLGVKGLMIPSAGNAGGAAAAYGARAGLPVAVVVPRATPEAAIAEAILAGARVFTVDGTIATAGKVIASVAAGLGWFDLATLKEPYRLEGKKTMGLELAEQLGWEAPDVLMYPTGGGTGLVGIWKAFDELAAMGWIKPAQPRFVAVQAEGCAPVVKGWAEGAETTADLGEPRHRRARASRSRPVRRTPDAAHPPRDQRRGPRGERGRDHPEPRNSSRGSRESGRGPSRPPRSPPCSG